MTIFPGRLILVLSIVAGTLAACVEGEIVSNSTPSDDPIVAPTLTAFSPSVSVVQSSVTRARRIFLDFFDLLGSGSNGLCGD